MASDQGPGARGKVVDLADRRRRRERERLINKIVNGPSLWQLWACQESSDQGSGARGQYEPIFMFLTSNGPEEINMASEPGKTKNQEPKTKNGLLHGF